MNWLDVFGPPGAGKSTICNPLWHEKGIGWDERGIPFEWRAFFAEIRNLLWAVRDHWSYRAAVRMNERSLKKMATVSRMESDKPYIQTGFVQRGLGFGWRLNDMGADLNLIRPFFELMPVSLGVAFLGAPLDVIIARNHARRLVPATAHEDRAFQVPLMEEPIKIAKEVLRARGVRTIDIDTSGDIDSARAALVSFACEGIGDAAAHGSGGQVAVLSAPA
jgi:hypothetical protein